MGGLCQGKGNPWCDGFCVLRFCTYCSMWSLALLIYLLCYSLKIQGAPSKTMALGNTFPSPLDTFTLNRSPPACTPSCLPHTVLLFFFPFPSPFTWWTAISKHRDGIWMAIHRHHRQNKRRNRILEEMTWKNTSSILSILKFQFTAFFLVLPCFFLSVVSHETLYLLSNSFFWNKPKQY